MSDDMDGKGRGKVMGHKGREKSLFSRSHQMALLHVVLNVIFLGI